MAKSQRPLQFCLVPAERAGRLLTPLREHFAGDPLVAVLVEQRAPNGARRPVDAAGRRQPRAPVAERDPLRALPSDLHHEARGLRFVQRLEPLGRRHEDTDTTELVRMSRARDPDAVSELWWRVSERVHARLRPRVGGVAAEEATPEVLGRVLDELERFDPGRERLSDWLNAVVDSYADDRYAGDRGWLQR